MPDIIRDLHSLSNFKRNTADFIRQLKESGRPAVLTMNGKAELIVQDIQSYQKLLDIIDRLEAIESLREGLKDIEEGRSRSMKDVMEEIRKKHGIPL